MHRSIARVQVGKLIDEWCDLNDLVSGPLSGKSTQDIQEARARFPELSNKTAAELKRIFDQDSVAAQFEALPKPPIGQDECNIDVRRGLAEAAKQRIEWLTELKDKLDIFPESPNISRRVRPT
jgi:hypothetical protein